MRSSQPAVPAAQYVPTIPGGPVPHVGPPSRDSLRRPAIAARRPRARHWPGLLAGAFWLQTVGCAPSPVEWRGDPLPLAGALGEERSLDLRGVQDHVVASTLPVRVPSRGLPDLGPGACLGSVRWARADTTDVAVVWWAARPDSSVVLRLSRSRDDGAHWDTVRVADTRDHGVRGCARPAAAVALDPPSGYTHLAYYLEPSTGAGLFYQHLMDLGRHTSALGATDTVAMFHGPQAIVYGEGPAGASVAARGDTVVVAYQDPNGTVPRIALAMSTTAGHAFPFRIDVSNSDVSAWQPLVTLDGVTVAVAWRESAAFSDRAPDRDPGGPGRNVVRVGTIR